MRNVRPSAPAKNEVGSEPDHEEGQTEQRAATAMMGMLSAITAMTVASSLDTSAPTPASRANSAIPHVGLNDRADSAAKVSAAYAPAAQPPVRRSVASLALRLGHGTLPRITNV